MKLFSFPEQKNDEAKQTSLDYRDIWSVHTVTRHVVMYFLSDRNFKKYPTTKRILIALRKLQKHLRNFKDRLMRDTHGTTTGSFGINSDPVLARRGWFYPLLFRSFDFTSINHRKHVANGTKKLILAKSRIIWMLIPSSGS